MHLYRGAEVRNKTENAFDCENEIPMTARSLDFIERGTTRIKKHLHMDLLNGVHSICFALAPWVFPQNVSPVRLEASGSWDQGLDTFYLPETV